MLEQILITFLVLFVGILGASIGVLISNKKKRELKGSCGGPEMNPDCCRHKGEECEKHTEN